MKLSICATLLLGASALVPAVLADTEYFNRPVPGSVFYKGSNACFLLDKMDDDDDKVILAQLYRHKEKDESKIKVHKREDDDEDDDDEDDDDDDDDEDDDDDDEDDDDDDEDDDDDDEDDDDNNDDNDDDKNKDDNDKDNDDDNDDDDDDDEDGDNSGLKFTQTIQKWYGKNIGDNNSDFSFCWTVPQNVTTGRYHVQMETRELNDDGTIKNDGDGDGGDQDDMVRSHIFHILDGQGPEQDTTEQDTPTTPSSDDLPTPTPTEDTTPTPSPEDEAPVKSQPSGQTPITLHRQAQPDTTEGSDNVNEKTETSTSHFPLDIGSTPVTVTTNKALLRRAQIKRRILARRLYH